MSTITAVIPTLPPAPVRGTPANNYVNIADTWAAALPAFGDSMNTMSAQFNAVAAQVNLDATNAASNAAAAATSAAAAAASAASASGAAGTNATSTTSDTISLGSTTLTIQTGKAFVVGQFVTIAYTTDPANFYMHGQITAYDSGTGSLTVEVRQIYGSGTFSTWTVGITAPVPTYADDITALAILSVNN